jgi:Tat protein secretion system quality control protein TatD with DNase activity
MEKKSKKNLKISNINVIDVAFHTHTLAVVKICEKRRRELQTVCATAKPLHIQSETRAVVLHIFSGTPSPRREQLWENSINISMANIILSTENIGDYERVPDTE